MVKIGQIETKVIFLSKWTYNIALWEPMQKHSPSTYFTIWTKNKKQKYAPFICSYCICFFFVFALLIVSNFFPHQSHPNAMLIEYIYNTLKNVKSLNLITTLLNFLKKCNHHKEQPKQPGDRRTGDMQLGKTSVPIE